MFWDNPQASTISKHRGFTVLHSFQRVDDLPENVIFFHTNFTGQVGVEWISVIFTMNLFLWQLHTYSRLVLFHKYVG